MVPLPGRTSNRIAAQIGTFYLWDDSIEMTIGWIGKIGEIPMFQIEESVRPMGDLTRIEKQSSDDQDRLIIAVRGQRGREHTQITRLVDVA